MVSVLGFHGFLISIPTKSVVHEELDPVGLCYPREQKYMQVYPPPLCPGNGK